MPPPRSGERVCAPRSASLSHVLFLTPKYTPSLHSHPRLAVTSSIYPDLPATWHHLPLHTDSTMAERAALLDPRVLFPISFALVPASLYTCAHADTGMCRCVDPLSLVAAQRPHRPHPLSPCISFSLILAPTFPHIPRNDRTDAVQSPGSLSFPTSSPPPSCTCVEASHRPHATSFTLTLILVPASLLYPREHRRTLARTGAGASFSPIAPARGNYACACAHVARTSPRRTAIPLPPPSHLAPHTPSHPRSLDAAIAACAFARAASPAQCTAGVIPLGAGVSTRRYGWRARCASKFSPRESRPASLS
ncbi:hypothetical protein B0H16DRAFT_1646581 [Mycena metata]|uniref:Uncharacterized protein n=1 Tax=Mycena metata TaxID=1033252 RepID=A0AAD7GM21_9AGAR|nr:hypothetical protein B0H16DRAFT_1646581 [Mycena metata]